jgi:ABC-type branched-subunit amino acid transport system permease subunit
MGLYEKYAVTATKLRYAAIAGVLLSVAGFFSLNQFSDAEQFQWVPPLLFGVGAMTGYLVLSQLSRSGDHEGSDQPPQLLRSHLISHTSQRLATYAGGIVFLLLLVAAVGVGGYVGAVLGILAVVSMVVTVAVVRLKLP